MLVLVTGKLHVTNTDGKLIGQVLPGASFGEMACLTGNKRFVGFEAVEPSTALSLSRSALRSQNSTPRSWRPRLSSWLNGSAAPVPL